MNENKTSPESVSVPKVFGEIASSFNSILAKEFTFFKKTFNYRWNVTGPRFQSLHIYLGEQYDQLAIVIDEIIERVRILDELPVNTVKEMYSKMKLKEEGTVTPSDERLAKNNSIDHLTIREIIL